jgi:hypothetical protein
MARTRFTPRGSRVVTVGVVIAASAAGLGLWLGLGTGQRVPGHCSVAGRQSTYVVDPEQARHATTIAAVGKRLGLPDHAVTIALAAALQESKLHNVRHGDRDSLGLFQQRPSQGWGSAAQVLDPAYAASAFYAALVKVPDWEHQEVTVAAQDVQRSAAPEAYAGWEGEARTLASVLTGEVHTGLACRLPRLAPHIRRQALRGAALTELGSAPFGRPVSTARGWLIASWLVGHAADFHVTSVRFAGHLWTPKAARWRIDPRPAAPGVTFTQ